MARWVRIGALSVVIVLVVVLIGAEFAGRAATERIAERQLRDNGIGGSVEVRLGRDWWRPSFLPALVSGHLDRVTIELQGGNLSAVPVVEADYVLSDVEVQIAVRDRTIQATSIGSGSVRVLIDPADIGALYGTEAALLDGRIVLGPDRQPAELSIVGDDLVLSGASLPAGVQQTSFRVVDPQLLPCAPQVRLLDTLVELSCTGDDLPGILERPLGFSGTSIAPPTPSELEPPATLEAPATSTPATSNPATSTAGGPTTTTPLGGNDGGG